MIYQHLALAIDQLAHELSIPYRAIATGIGPSLHYMTYLPEDWNPRMSTVLAIASNMGVHPADLIRRAYQIAHKEPVTQVHVQQFSATHHIPSLFAKTLKHMRTERGISLGQLAKRCSLDKSNLSHREQVHRCNVMPTLRFIEIVSDGLRIPLHEFLQRMIDPQEETAAA